MSNGGGGMENEDSSDEEGQAFYVGGSEHSGQQVVGPNKGKKKPGKLIQHMFDSARAHGAEPVAGGSGSSGDRQAQTFRGTGYKLGETSDDTEVIADPSGAMGSGPKSMSLVLKLWKNGFSIQGDGMEEELKSYSDPNNAKLLNAIAKGQVPDEFLALANGGQVHMDMEDHREQDFVAPKKKMKAFSGAGQALGSPTPVVVSSSANQFSPGATPPKVEIDESQPTTTVQIRLSDGTRKVQKFNHTHTVGDIRQFVAGLPGYEAATFQLQTNFPVKNLTEDTQTLKEAQLLNATIIQRLV
ncbi:NSFL1 cofactor p47-like isoform X1 [Convolutriloba macropyga]|uniref:NSFL1 cofactor p47-like isoform X1 n=1 Tax=Convolutriloba macropyga TaxID=536237 RepID=UPI003F51AF26